MLARRFVLFVVWDVGKRFRGRIWKRSLLVRLLVVVLVLAVAVVSTRGRRGLVPGALPRPAADLLLHGRLALGAVPPAILLVPVRQGLAAKGQVVVLDRDDGHPGGLRRLGVVIGGGRGVRVVPGGLL